jgi:hypothetical protein
MGYIKGVHRLRLPAGQARVRPLPRHPAARARVTDVVAAERLQQLRGEPLDGTPRAAARVSLSPPSSRAHASPSKINPGMQCNTVGDFATQILDADIGVDIREYEAGLYRHIIDSRGYEALDALIAIVVKQDGDVAEADSRDLYHVYAKPVAGLTRVLCALALEHPEKFGEQHLYFLITHACGFLEFVRPIYLLDLPRKTYPTETLSQQEYSIYSIGGDYLAQGNWEMTQRQYAVARQRILATYGEDSLEYAQFCFNAFTHLESMASDEKCDEAKRPGYFRTAFEYLKTAERIASRILSSRHPWPAILKGQIAAVLLQIDDYDGVAEMLEALEETLPLMHDSVSALRQARGFDDAEAQIREHYTRTLLGLIHSKIAADETFDNQDEERLRIAVASADRLLHLRRSKTEANPEELLTAYTFAASAYFFVDEKSTAAMYFRHALEIISQKDSSGGIPEYEFLAENLFLCLLATGEYIEARDLTEIRRQTLAHYRHQIMKSLDTSKRELKKAEAANPKVEETIEALRIEVSNTISVLFEYTASQANQCARLVELNIDCKNLEMARKAHENLIDILKSHVGDPILGTLLARAHLQLCIEELAAENTERAAQLCHLARQLVREGVADIPAITDSIKSYEINDPFGAFYLGEIQIAAAMHDYTKLISLQSIVTAYLADGTINPNGKHASAIKQALQKMWD